MRTAAPVAAGQAHIAICNWRDLRHPEGGGSELYIEAIATRLAAAGNRVTLMSAAVEGAPRDEDRAGVGNRLRDSVQKILVGLGMAAADGVRLVMDVPGRVVRVQDQSFNICRAEMEHARFVVIDPNDGMIVMLAHGIMPFLAIWNTRIGERAPT